jgi:MoaA/NifB/PqqE/SkfB family radical SAM enzyme
MNIDKLFIDFRITSKCHLDCEICIRNAEMRDSSLDDIRKVFAKMARMGLTRIVVSGGEPTIRKDYLQIIECAKQYNFLVYLATVGEKFIKDFQQLEKNLDLVGLPIDGITYEISTLARSVAMGTQHERIYTIFSWLNLHPTNVKIKLTTVVSKVNIHLLSDIIKYVNNLPYPYSTWRFYQFCALGMGKGKRNKFDITADYFFNTMNDINKKFNDTRISWASFAERDRANIIMESNFDIMIPEGENYSYVCNMMHDKEDYILTSLSNRDDVLERCLRNRNWIA